MILSVFCMCNQSDFRSFRLFEFENISFEIYLPMGLSFLLCRFLCPFQWLLLFFLGSICSLLRELNLFFCLFFCFVLWSILRSIFWSWFGLIFWCFIWFVLLCFLGSLLWSLFRNFFWCLLFLRVIGFCFTVFFRVSFWLSFLPSFLFCWLFCLFFGFNLWFFLLCFLGWLWGLGLFFLYFWFLDLTVFFVFLFLRCLFMRILWLFGTVDYFGLRQRYFILFYSVPHGSVWTFWLPDSTNLPSRMLTVDIVTSHFLALP